MSRAGVIRHRFARTAVVASASLVFAACNSSPATVAVIGHPSISIQVPLTLTACTTSDSCVALGTSALGTGPAATAQDRRANGTWVVLHTPATRSATIVTSSCWHSGCLFAGTSPSAGDLVWRFREGDPTLATLPAPPLGVIVTSLSCFGQHECVLIDSPSLSGNSRLVVTTDGGVSWSTPADLPWSSGLYVNAFACVNTRDCVAAAVPAVSAGLAQRPPPLEVTHNGGITWHATSLPPGTERLTSLSCFTHHCDALIGTAHGVEWGHSRALGSGWVVRRLSGTASAMACTPSSHCVIVGTLHGKPWLATTSGSSRTTRSLRYAPASFTAAACGASLCALSAPSTVATLTP